MQRSARDALLQHGRALQGGADDDLRCCLDLGLVRETEQGGLAIANPIYAEIIPRSLAYGTRAALPQLAPTWLDATGALDVDALLSAFLSFWRRHGDALIGAAPYPEVAPHLVLLAFLDRIANGGGRVEREYAIGAGRMDVLLELRGVRVAMELKVWREGRRDPREEGLAQLDGHLAGLGLEEGWLVIFDRRATARASEDRVAVEEARTPGGRGARVVRA